MNILAKIARRVGRKRAPELSAEQQFLNDLRATVESSPPKTPGLLRSGGYTIAYADAHSLVSQWEEIFLRGGLKFTAAGPAPRILDCGANVGMASLYFKRLYPGARITAFEADPEIADVCRRNLAANGCGDVEVENAAVWTRDGSLSFCCEGGDSGTIDGLHYDGIDGSRREVPSIRLRDRLSKGKIDLLKLDVEGAESEILADCAEHLVNVSALIMEIHETDREQRKTPVLLKLLSDAGFEYVMNGLVPIWWRGKSFDDRHPFPGRQPHWVVMVQAWRSANASDGAAV